MDRFEPHIARRAVDNLLPQMDGRRGSLLLIGAHLPEVAIHVLRRGLIVTVNEPDPRRMEAFLEPLKAESVDKSVSWDRRPYSGVEFLSSSYNFIVAWEGLPTDMPMELFFKKSRRELKAGGTLFVRARVFPNPVKDVKLVSRALGAMPDKAADRLKSAAIGLRARICPDGSLDSAVVTAVADRFLNLEDITALSIVNERLDMLPELLRQPLDKLPGILFSLLEKFDSTLSDSPAGSRLATTVLFRLAKTKEFGRIFMVK